MPVTAPQRPKPTAAAAAWDELRKPLLAFIARRAPDRDTADDILQDVLLRVHRHAGELEHAPALHAWIYRIARNAIADHYRRAAVRREHPAGIDVDALGPPREPATDELRLELAACMTPLLERLPAPARDALVLTELEGITQAAGAAQLGLSTSGMKSRVQRARVQLRELLVECCEIELDRRNGVTGYKPRHEPCDCRSAPPQLPT